MKNKVLILSYDDGTLAVWAHPDRELKREHPPGTKGFLVKDNTPIIEICEWIGACYRHPEFKEIEIKIRP